ncbi:MAG TPA: hypothetical protein VGF55_26990 [Gemmataceae bacterium]|jgi:hypothetical protein
MRRRWIVAGLLLVGAGCNRQDAECLGRVGHLVANRLEKLKPGAAKDGTLAGALPGYGPPEQPADGNRPDAK